jgi:glycosyltransferase involved in cell wall biosynthesis
LGIIEGFCAGGRVGAAKATSGRIDRDFRGALVYASGFGLTAILAYAFNALMGRRLSAQDFATYGALLAALLALAGPSTALFGGAAMATARNGMPTRPRWYGWLLGFGVASAVAGCLPLSETLRAVGWFGLATSMLLLVAWNRGMLIGSGRLGLVGGTMVVEGVGRITFALLLVAAGWRVVGASAGLALGVGAAFLLTELLLPRQRSREPQPVAPDAWVAATGLLFLGLVQFADVIAVRVVSPHQAGPYAAASSIARMALYAQFPATAYALRRTAVAGARRAMGRTLLLALVPMLAALAVLEIAPGWLLSFTYGGRYPGAVALVRILALAMAAGGLGLVLVNMAMGAGRSAWAGTMSAFGTLGVGAIFLVARDPMAAALAMLAAQAGVLALGIAHAGRLVASERGADGAVLFLNWRDTRHPQGGGSEVYVEEIARRLAASGRRVTMFSAEHDNAPRQEVREGVHHIRRGSWRTVYLWAGAYHLLGRFGRHDVVVDVQNAVPFFAPLYCGRPVVVLVHHVHREQWSMNFRGWRGRAGWWVESRLAPWIYRKARYVAVSDATKRDLCALGVDAERVSVVNNGASPVVPVGGPAARPTVVYLGRLVPHKRVELVLDAAARLREEVPGLAVRIVGQGPWDGELRAHAAALELDDRTVTFEGFVDDATKLRILQGAWVLALPSVMEGWGLAVMEAASAGIPAVAFRVGGLVESVIDGTTGLLVDDPAGFERALRDVLTDAGLRERLGAAARGHAARYSWDGTTEEFGRVLERVRGTAEAETGLALPSVSPVLSPAR